MVLPSLWLGCWLLQGSAASPLAEYDPQPSAPPLPLVTQDSASRAQAIEDSSRSRWSSRVSVVGHHFFANELEDGPGEVAVQQLDARLGLGRRLSDRRRLGLFARIERSIYDFDDQASIGGFRFHELDLVRLSASHVTEFNPDTVWTVTGGLALGFESGAEMSEALTYGLGSTISFRLNSSFLVTLGGFGWTRLDDDPLYYPWFQLDWSPTEKLHIGSEGQGYGVGYAWYDDLSAYLNFSFVERNFRLDHDRPGIVDGVVRDGEFALNTGLIWQANDRLRVELYGGLALRQLTVLDDVSIGVDDTIEPTPYVALNLGYSL